MRVRVCVYIDIYMTHGHFFFFLSVFFLFLLHLYKERKANMTFFQATRPQNSKLTNSFF